MRCYPYKQAVVLVFRTFFPLFAILDHTGMPALGSTLRTTRKVLYLEKLMAALLLCAPAVRASLNTAISNARTPGSQDSSHTVDKRKQNSNVSQFLTHRCVTSLLCQ